MRIAINGFGRIGRTFLRTILQDATARKRLEVVAINIGPAKIEFTAHLFKYDTTMGIFQGSVAMQGDTLVVDDQVIQIIAQREPAACNWAQYTIDWVVDASGAFTTRAAAEGHLQAGARAVLITAPAHDEDISIIPGVNHMQFDSKKHCIVSLGSCTTNAFIPMLKVLHDNFGITNGFMTTVHAYTSSQVLLDNEGKSLRLSRAAPLNIIPTGTGASKMLAKILPELGPLIKSISLRVPVSAVSLIDLTVTTQKQVDAATINETFIQAAQSNLKGILAFTQEPLVSSDFIGNSYSVTIDGLSTDTVKNVAKVMGWYDNEWGYSERLKDFLLMI